MYIYCRTKLDYGTFFSFLSVHRMVSTTIKKKIKFSSYIRKFRLEQLQSHMTNGLLIYGEIFAHFLKYEEALPHV
jgi:hypothetical protein